MRNQNEDRDQNPALSRGLVRTISDRIGLLAAILGGLFWLTPFQPTLSGAPIGTPSPATALDTQTRTSVIEAAAKALQDKYIFPDVGKQMADKIRQNNSSKEYDALTSGEDLSRRLTDDLYTIAHDRHIRVRYPDPDVHAGPPSAEDQARFQRRAAWINFAFPEVKRLAGNIGYIRVDALLPPTIGGDTANAAMAFLANTDTFSGSEELAYDLKALKRATIVGEVTGGGANPGDVFPLPDSFSIFVPTGRAVNPITKTNWEGVGVQPDVVVTADKALDLAHYLALKKLPSGQSASDPKAKEINAKLQELEKEFPQK